MTEKSISLGDNSIIIRQLKSVIGQFGKGQDFAYEGTELCKA